MSENLKRAMKRQDFEEKGTHISLNVADGGALIDGFFSDAHVETTRVDGEAFPYVYIKIDGKSSKNPKHFAQVIGGLTFHYIKELNRIVEDYEARNK